MVVIKYCRFCGDDTTELDGCCLKCAPAAQRELEARWAKICPPAFRATDPARLPDPVAYQRAVKYGAKNRSLLLYGATGGGKSRVAWLIAQDRFFQDRKSVRSLDTFAGLEYASRFAKGSDEAARYVRALMEADVLLLDDVFKSKLTEAFEAMIFAVIDRRSVQIDRPIIYTINDDSETLKQRVSPDRAEPLLRRLREFCDQVQFRKAVVAP